MEKSDEGKQLILFKFSSSGACFISALPVFVGTLSVVISKEESEITEKENASIVVLVHRMLICLKIITARKRRLCFYRCL